MLVVTHVLDFTVESPFVAQIRNLLQGWVSDLNSNHHPVRVFAWTDITQTTKRHCICTLPRECACLVAIIQDMVATTEKP